MFGTVRDVLSDCERALDSSVVTACCNALTRDSDA